MCCAQKRKAVRTVTITDLQGKVTVAQAQKTEQSSSSARLVDLLYLRQSPIQMRGMATGLFYQFSSFHPVQCVDERDATAFLRTRLFRRTK